MSKYNTGNKLHYIFKETNEKKTLLSTRTYIIAIIHRVIHAAVCHSLSLHCSWMFLDFSKLLPPRSARHHPGPFPWGGEEPVDDTREKQRKEIREYVDLEITERKYSIYIYNPTRQQLKEHPNTLFPHVLEVVMHNIYWPKELSTR